MNEYKNYQFDYTKKSDKVTLTTGWAVVVVAGLVAMLIALIVMMRTQWLLVEQLDKVSTLSEQIMLNGQYEVMKRDVIIQEQQYEVDSLKTEIKAICYENNIPIR